MPEAHPVATRTGQVNTQNDQRGTICKSEFSSRAAVSHPLAILCTVNFYVIEVRYLLNSSQVLRSLKAVNVQCSRSAGKCHDLYNPVKRQGCRFTVSVVIS